MSVSRHEVVNPANLVFVEALYASYLANPASVDDVWRRHFEAWANGGRLAIGPSFKPSSLFNPPASASAVVPLADIDAAALQRRVEMLIRNYRVRGHIMARLDPLGRVGELPPEIDPAYYGLSEADMRREVSAETMPGARTLGSVIERLRNTYCRSIGVQFMHIDELSVREWLQRRMEGSQNRLALSRDEQLRILTKLTDAVIFEEFVQKKYLGAKSFSLEGAESLIPLLELAIEKAGAQGIDEVVLGMAHRGRLNVLANIMGKSPRQIFREFEDRDPELQRGGGDVKYHLGYAGERVTAAGQVYLALAFNPSHLEHVNPVVLGRVRAKQDRLGDVARRRGMAILIHGDAAFAGQGLVQETLNLSELAGYRVGGTLHVIINNQLGFTTTPEEGRSTVYATDVAKMLQSPIFHVNGEDPEAVAQVVTLAMEFRHTFQRDVVIDMYCFRRHGHNEGDEPSFTQPLLYEAIRQRKPLREAYLDHLLQLGGITQAEADQIAAARREQLEQELSAARQGGFGPTLQPFQGLWQPYRGGAESNAPEVLTGVRRELLQDWLVGLATVPDGFNLNPKLARLLLAKREMAQGRPLDWATAEALAWASLLSAGYRVRLSGQDSQRGTFSQRHAVLHDAKTGEAYLPLRQLFPQAPLDIINSPLSEAGVLGFEYGYSLAYPDGLVMWEAQFGDFSNCAQAIIDQFIASAEDKWQRLSGVVLLLPHGFEGQGPEHSSARLERFLTLAANDNLQIANPTTPAQYFHLLRRQVLRVWRKPLVVMTPKSLLRHPQAQSSLDELAQGRFLRILPDDQDPAAVRRILLCSGKLYYELAAEREKLSRRDVAILRLEQLYPLYPETLRQALAPYAAGTPVTWVQEEPENMGAWRYLRATQGAKLLGQYPFAGIFRPASASPATGSASAHQLEQSEIIQAALAG